MDINTELGRALRLLEQRRDQLDKQIVALRTGLGDKGTIRKNGRGTFKCPRCGRRFPYAMNLGRHTKASH